MAKRGSRSKQKRRGVARGNRGYPLTTEDKAWRRREEEARAAEGRHPDSSTTPAQFKVLERAREVFAQRKGRKKRARTKSGKLRASYRASQGDERTHRTHYKRQLAGHQVEVVRVRYFGPDAFDKAETYLLKLRDDEDTRERYIIRGRVSIGTGYGKNDRWVGSKTHHLDELILYLTKTTHTQSEDAVLGQEGDNKDNVWVELEIVKYPRSMVGTASVRGTKRERQTLGKSRKPRARKGKAAGRKSPASAALRRRKR